MLNGVYHLRKDLPGSAFTCYKYREIWGHLNGYVNCPVQSLMIANYSKPCFTLCNSFIKIQ